MQAGAARFVAGAARAAQFPGTQLPEVAFAGRSNVGKSSLLNRLVGQRGLARVSKTPGRTQQINFFEVGEKLMIADLPGYGFARVPAAVQEAWRELIETYLARRRQLRAVVLIVDVRRGIEHEEELLIDFLASHGRKTILVVTKADKVGRGERAERLRRIGERWADLPAVAFSALTGEGAVDVWAEVRAATGLAHEVATTNAERRDRSPRRADASPRRTRR
jgi:GTP-binding protein